MEVGVLLALCLWPVFVHPAPTNEPVVFKNTRFSFYSSRLVRMEWSSTATFDDRPTITFNNRKLPMVIVDVTPTKTGVFIDTFTFTLTATGFNFAAGEIAITMGDILWIPGTQDTRNLNGSLLASDCYIGADPCIQQYYEQTKPGLLSRDGWTLIDDSTSDALVPAGNGWQWRESRPNRTHEYLDWYFFGYKPEKTLQYTNAIKDFTVAAGKIPLMPYSWFGVWWSRYWPYNVSGITEVIEDYKKYELPLNGVVIDMDWHIEPPAIPKCWGWGGFDWNTTLFPQPKKFHDWLNMQGLPLMLNIHTQCGVDHCQSMYKHMVEHVGGIMDDNVVPCWTHNYTYQTGFYEYVFNQNPDLNFVEYLWTDYGNLTGKLCDDKGYFVCQQDERTGTKPLLWSNYLHGLFESHDGGNTTRKSGRATHIDRPIVLSPYGGLGNHRYPLTGSGDTYRAWVTLAWEVMMTPVAANVLAGWTHDIGGYHVDQKDPLSTTADLFLRWVQYGTFSHIFRTHCDHCEIRAWKYATWPKLQGWYQLRAALMPYLYTAAYQAYNTGILLIHPLYYEYPQTQEVYDYKYQYLFGGSMLCSPVVTHDTMKETYLPPGNWTSWFDNEHIYGPRVVTSKYSYDEIPVWIRRGHIIPMKHWHDTISSWADPTVLLYPLALGSSAQVELWEDDGLSLSYQNEVLRPINITQQTDTGGDITVTITPPDVLPPECPPTKRYQLEVRGWNELVVLPAVVKCNSVDVPHLKGKPPSPKVVGWWVQQAAQAGVSPKLQELWVSCPEYASGTQVSIQVFAQ